MSETSGESGALGEIPPEIMDKLNSGELTAAEVLGISPELQYEIANIGYRLFQAGQYDKAREVYEALVALSPKDPTFHCHLGATLYSLGRMEDALPEYERAVALNEGYGDALVGRGELRLRAGRSQEGLADLKKAIALDPQSTLASTTRAKSTVIALERQAQPKPQSAAMPLPAPPSVKARTATPEKTKKRAGKK